MSTPTPSGFVSPTILPPSAPYNPFPTTLAPYIGAVVMETFLYGVYCVLFGICCFVLMRRHKALHWVLLIFAICMFSIATADIIYTYAIFFNQLLAGTATFKTLYPKYVLFVTNTALADTMLLYRCYVVWGHKKRVVLGPVVLLFAATVVGYLFEGASMNLFQHSWVYLAMTFALNIILTALTAGRIFYLARHTQSVIDEDLMKRYNMTIAMLIESGLIYSVYMIFNLAFHNNPTANVLLDAGLVQIVGIVPTLIIVQVGLGRAVDGDSELGEKAIQSRYSTATPHHGPGSYIASIRSARSSRISNHTPSYTRETSHELDEHRRSFRSVASRSGKSQRRPSHVDANTSQKLVYDLRLSDSYTLPPSPSLRSAGSPSLRTSSIRSPGSPRPFHFPGSPTFPPSPALEEPETVKPVDEKGFQPFSDFGETMSRIESASSTRTTIYYSTV